MVRRAISMLAAVTSLWREERMSVQSQTLIYPDLNFTDTFDEDSSEQFPALGHRANIRARCGSKFLVGKGDRKKC